MDDLADDLALSDSDAGNGRGAGPLAGLFATLWQQYVDITPDAGRIHALLEQRGERIVNDHIALRTFGVPTLGIDVVARAFVAGGYRPAGQYDFARKKLSARHYEHPDPALPKVFISELRVGEFSPGLRETVANLVAQVPAGVTERADLPACGRPWAVSHGAYLELLAESEYAAWMAAFGYRANHFTVDVGALRTLGSVEELNQLLVERGFELNDSGGAIKGSPAEFLEQSSTRARSVPVEFSDRTADIRSCYYEFARRYRRPDGTLFNGFVTQSADKLFESTDARAGGE